MTVSVTELTPQILALNTPDKAFVYKISGNTIVGSWNILDAKWLNLLSAQHAQTDYQVTFTLDEQSGTFDFCDNAQSSNATAGASGLSAKKDFFSGKQMSMKKGVKFGFAMQDKDKPTQPAGIATYDFNTSTIKQPIIELLKSNGWKQKGGFLAKLFGG